MKLSQRLARLYKVLIVVTVLISAQGLFAQAVWNGGAGDGLWSSGANWSTAAPPTAGQTATIPNTFTTTVDPLFAGTIAGLTVGGGATGTVILQRSLTVLGPVVLNPGATFTANAQNLLLTGNFTVGGPGGAAIFNAGTGSVLFIDGAGATQTLTSYTTPLTFNNVSINQGVPNVAAGVVFDNATVVAMTININGNFTFTFPDQLGLTLTQTGGGGNPSLVYGGSSTIVYNSVNTLGQNSQLPGSEFTSTINSLTVSVSGTFTNGLDITALGTRTVDQNVSISSGLVTHTGQTLNVGGNITTGTLTTNGSYVGGTIFMIGNQAQSISAGSGSISNLTINKTNTTDVVTVSSGILNVTDVLDVQNGILSLGSGSTGLNISGTGSEQLIVQSGGTFQTGGKSVTNAGTYDLQTGSVFQFNGSTKETTPSGLTFSTLRMSNTGGLDIAGSVTVDGALDFTVDGTVDVGGANTLTIGPSASITGGSASRYVNGPLQKEFSSGGSFVYPVGDASNYRPATFNYTTFNIGAGNSIVEVEWSKDAFSPNTPPTGISSIDQQSHYIVQEAGTAPTPFVYDFTGTFEEGNFSPESRNRALVETGSSYTLSATNTVDGGANTVVSEDFTAMPAGSGFIVFGAGGTSLTWDGGDATDDWSLANNWNPDGVPTSEDDVTIDLVGGVIVTIGSATSAVASSLTLGGGADAENELLITSTSVTPLTITNGLTVNSDGKLNFNAANGDISAGSTTFNTGSTVEYQSRNIPVDDYDDLIINGATGTSGSGTVTVSGSLTKDGAAFSSSHAITVTGSYTNTSGNATYNSGLTVNGTPFTITSGIISGTVSVNSTTTTVNGGSFGGTVTYSGSGAQAIGGTGSISYANLTINNSSANITLNDPVSVTGLFTLTNGLVNTSTDLLTLGSAASVSGGSTGSHVNGPMATTGTGNKVFPIGAGGDYRPVELLSVSGSSPVIQFEMTNGDPGGTVDVTLNNISNVRSWLGSLNSGGFTSAQVKLEWGADDGVDGALGDLRVATSATQGGTYTSAGNSGTTGTGSSGTITSNSVSTLQFFTLGSDAGDNSLPVSLSSFEAAPTSGGVSLTWVTESELENEGFNIYRRDVTDKSEWNLITASVIPGRGNTSEKSEYEFIDQSVVAGLTYEYMLESISYSGVRVQEMVIEVAVPVPNEYAMLGNYPNPFNPSTNIRFRLPETTDVSISIYGIQGNLVRELALNQSFEAGDHFVSWDATDNTGQRVASGMYVYLFTAGKYQKTEKMLLLK